LAIKVTKKKLEDALETYANLVEVYPDNEAYLQRYADMLQTLGREATATITLQHLHDVIAQRNPDEAAEFAKKYPQIGRISLEEIFDAQDAHRVTGKIITELLSSIWLRLHRKKLKAGQAVYQADELSDSLTLVIDGRVEIYARTKENTRVLLESVGSYDVLAEQTFFHPNQVSFDAYVESESASIVQIPRAKLKAMVKSNPHLASMLELRAAFRTNIRIIATHPIFNTLPLKLCKYLARNLSMESYTANSMIHSLEKKTMDVAIILSGEACYLAKDKAGKKLKLPPLPLRSLVGNIRLQHKNDFQAADLYANSNVKVANIPYQNMLNISTAFPPLVERLNQHAETQQQRIILALAKLKQ
jgi:CRP-like cAMP-binding protein